jgi:hypothetical protein
VLPEQLDVRGKAVYENEIEIAIAKDLVGKVYVSASRVPGLRSNGGCSLRVYGEPLVQRAKSRRRVAITLKEKRAWAKMPQLDGPLLAGG